MAKTFLTSIDLNGNQLLNTVLENTATIPTLNLKKGRAAFDTANNKVIVYDGSIWKNLEWELVPGTTSQYYRGDKTWQTLNTTAVTEGNKLYFTDARVRSTVLTGYASGTSSAIAATDTLLTALGKIQGQLNAKQASDADLTAIAGLVGTTGFLKKTAANAWTLDTNTYLLSTGTASKATQLANAQNFSITGGATAAAISFNGTGAVALNVTSLDASKLATTTTIPSAVLGRSTLYIGTTAVALNRPSSALALTGITSIAIGSAVLKYDAANNALYVEKSDGTAANFYSTGANSAYGAGSGTGGGGGGGVTALSLLSDVSLTTPASGNVLIYNGTHWENKPQSVLVPDLSSYAQKTYVDTEIANLVASSPAALDTLNELAAALGNDENFSQTVATEIGKKVTANTAITAGTKTKITYDSKGLVTAGASLATTDIPNLATSKITSGTFAVARGGTGKSTWTVGAVWASAATTLTSGTLPVAYGGTGITDAKGGFTRKYVGILTTSATSYAVTHNLNSDVVAQVIDTGTLDVVECDIVLTSANVTTFKFNVAPTANKYRYIIVG